MTLELDDGKSSVPASLPGTMANLLVALELAPEVMVATEAKLADSGNLVTSEACCVHYNMEVLYAR